jgi:hypothetical protein
MKTRFFLAVALATLLVPAARAETQFFGTAKIKPSFFSNFDFNGDLDDAAALTEGGWVAGEHLRAELRLGWKASGDKWSIMMIAEADVIMEKDTADRTFYGEASQSESNAATRGNAPNAGSEFGIERVELTYTFSPKLQLATGWNIRAMDIATGGMVFGDDHPFIELNGALSPAVKYQLGYLQIQNRAQAPDASTSPATIFRDPLNFNDWRAYYLKIPISVNAGTAKLLVSPFGVASDNTSKFARAYYAGFEVTGSIGMVKPYLEFAYVTGDFDTDRHGTGTAPVATDIRSMAGFAGLELGVSKAFNPYAAFRYTQGDDDTTDDTANGFVGVTDIGRFTGLLGMDGNILSEHLASGASPYNSPLYSFSPDRAVGGNGYGGIGNASSGNNPGQQLVAVGAKGDLGDFVANLSYKAQVFYIMWDKTENLGADIGKNAGTTVDVNLKYAFSKEFAIDYIGSVFLPGSGMKDINADYDTMAQAHTLTLAWTY